MDTGSAVILFVLGILALSVLIKEWERYEKRHSHHRAQFHRHA